MAAKPEPSIGIDLGTTNSVVAYIDPHGRPLSVANSEGDILTPSVVYFEENAPAIVGKEAIKAGKHDPDNVVEAVKRDMGKDVYHQPIQGRHLPPSAISGVILHRLAVDTTTRTGPFCRAVVTVPAYFNEPRRKATIDASLMAGLEEVELLNEPTAAALAFGYEMGIFSQTGSIDKVETKVPGKYTLLVYDLGGGTFDVTLMHIQGRHFRAVVCDGDVRLGGLDWDERIVNYVLERFSEQFGIDLGDSPKMLKEVRILAEEIKHTLTQRKHGVLQLEFEDNRLSLELTREDLVHLTTDLLGRTRMTCELAMLESGESWENLDAILLVGGSSRMPMVRDMLLELSGLEPNRSVSPDEAVAHGAALYAQMLWSSKSSGKIGDEVIQHAVGARITDINSHSLGIVGRDKRDQRRVSVLIPKNTPIPHSNSKVFKTRAPGQSRIYIQIVEGESVDPEDCAVIGECRLVDLPENLPEDWPVTVTFAYRRDGSVFVEAQIKGAKPFQLEIDRKESISPADAKAWADELIMDEERAERSKTITEKSASSKKAKQPSKRPSPRAVPLPKPIRSPKTPGSNEGGKE